MAGPPWDSKPLPHEAIGETSAIDLNTRKPSPEAVAGPPAAPRRIAGGYGDDVCGGVKKFHHPSGGPLTKRPLRWAMGAAAGFGGVHAIESVIDAMGAEGVGVDHAHVGERQLADGEKQENHSGFLRRFAPAGWLIRSRSRISAKRNAARGASPRAASNSPSSTSESRAETGVPGRFPLPS